MPADPAPEPVVDLAEARASARRSRDWATADRLKGEIEAAGWKVVDTGTFYDLQRAVPPVVTVDGVARHGSSATVPSRLDDAPVGVASVVMIATDWPDDLARSVRALVGRSPDGTQLVVVANDPSAAQADALRALDAVDPGSPGVVTDVVWTSRRLGYADALNAAIRSCVAPVVVLLDTAIEPQADLVTALVDALEDPSVAVAGPFGLVSADMRRFEPAAETLADVVAIEGVAMAFRRADFAARGPLDAHFEVEAYLDTWWSLVLRDTLDDDPEEREPRLARRVTGIPLARHEPRDWSGIEPAERERRARRNHYRLLKRFATRRDLLVG
jgi:hypothetical protein